MRAITLFLTSGLVLISFCVRGQVARTNDVDVPQAFKIASGLRVGMSSKKADAFLRQHGLMPGIDLMSTNGRPVARLFSMSVGGARPITMYYGLADGCVLALHVNRDAWYAEDGRLDRATIESNNIDLISIKLKNAPKGNEPKPAGSPR